MRAYIISDPWTAKTLAPFFGFSLPQLCPWAGFHFEGT